MTWTQFTAARQLLAEERLGRVIRTAEREEDDEFNATRKRLGRT